MFQRHVVRCLIAGFVALIPVGGLILSVVWLEYTISDVWLDDQSFYFPGLGLLAVTLALYLIGLVVTTFVGRWIWGRVDGFLNSLPFLGTLYSTLQQILGYGKGDQAIFREVVYVPSEFDGGERLGLVTERVNVAGQERVVVFLPGAPNPASGQLVLLDEARVRKADLPVDASMKALVSLGKTSLGQPEP